MEVQRFRQTGRHCHQFQAVHAKATGTDFHILLPTGGWRQAFARAKSDKITCDLISDEALQAVPSLPPRSGFRIGARYCKRRCHGNHPR
ncbi:hypothetical protein GCM10011317_04540 [Niveispirillum cyanobacteriorum]|nr:hypothetical protein GCM10011317_04540 [Niveispirillum cyanobacteriorum]